MKKIATGYYNSVYDLENGLVFKRKNSIFDRFKKIYSEEQDVAKTVSVMKKMPKEHLSPLEQEIRDGAFIGNLQLFANPTFKNGGYVQNKVITIKDYFATHSYDENKIIIDKYIKLIYQCWELHIHEEVFNFTVNNGVDKQGNIVLIDINETSRDKEKAQVCITSKRWLKSMSYLTLNPKLQEYYAEAMARGLTDEKLNQYWR